MHLLNRKKADSFAGNVYAATRRIPKGKVTTYAAIARIVGNLRAARAVGNALNRNPYKNVACHRVIRSDGKVGGYAHGTKAKIRILKREGATIIRGRINLARYGLHGKRYSS